MDSIELAIGPRPLSTLPSNVTQRLVHALSAVVGDGQPPADDVARVGVRRATWAAVVGQLSLRSGDAAPLLRLLARRMSAAQAQEFIDLLTLAFTEGP